MNDNDYTTRLDVAFKKIFASLLEISCVVSNASEHPLSKYNEFERGLYYAMLCVLGQIDNDTNTPQLWLLKSIMKSNGDGDSIADHIAQAKNYSPEQMYDLIDMIRECKLEDIFFIDGLLMTSIGGEIDHDCAMLLAELGEILIEDIDKIVFIRRLAKAVLKQDFKEIRQSVSENQEWAKLCKSLSFYVWDKNLYTTKNEIYYYSKTKEPLNETIADMDTVFVENKIITDKKLFRNIKAIHFINCEIKTTISFDRVDRLIIDNCHIGGFSNAAIMITHNTGNTHFSIRNTKFENIKVPEYSSARKSPKAVIIGGEIFKSFGTFDGCIFRNITSDNFECKTIIAGYVDLTVTNCTFERCRYNSCFSNDSYLFIFCHIDEKQFNKSNSCIDCCNVNLC